MTSKVVANLFTGHHRHVLFLQKEFDVFQASAKVLMSNEKRVTLMNE